MILHCNYEETKALQQGARTVLERDGGNRCAVAAPPGERAHVEALLPLLTGDVVISTLAEQRRIRSAMELIVECLRMEMEAMVTSAHPADEGAVAAYFDFAHSVAVLGRVRDLGTEMEAMVELITGEPADTEAARAFVFPD